MRNKKKTSLLVCLWMALVTSVFAEEQIVTIVPLAESPIQMIQPYVVEVLVVDRSKAERKRGFSQALRMILKEKSSIDHSNIQKALTNPKRYLKYYKYIKKDYQDEKKIFLRVCFDAGFIVKLEQPAPGKVVWVNDKPTVLLWLAKNANGGGILTEDNDDGITNILVKKSRELGVQVILPILDLDDISRVTANDICQFNASKIKTASNRYGVSVILMGCVKYTLGKIWSSQWLLLQDGREERFNFMGVNRESVINQALESISDSIINVITPVATDDTKVVLRIVNATGIDQYSEVEKYLRTFRNIEEVDFVNVGATHIELAVSIKGGRKALLGVLNNQHQLVPAGVDLYYKWVSIGNEKP